MFRGVFLLFLILTFFVFFTRAEESTQPVASSAEKSSKDFVIPRKLREIVEQRYLEFIRKENAKVVLTDEEVLARIPRDFLNSEVFLTSLASGTLKNDAQIVLPRGGGEIDLKNYVSGNRGSFFLKFRLRRPSTPKDDLSNLHVYYLSETEKKKIGGDEFGSGCNKFMDISDYVLAQNQGSGLQLNATDLRYLPVIGGTFYFFNFDPERKVYIAAIRFVDSRYPDMSCEKTKR